MFNTTRISLFLPLILLATSSAYSMVKKTSFYPPINSALTFPPIR